MKFNLRSYASVDVAEVEKRISEIYGIDVDLSCLGEMFTRTDQWFPGCEPETMPDWALEDINFYKETGYFDEMQVWEFLQDMVFRKELPPGDIWLECNL